MLILFHTHPFTGPFPDIQFGEAPGRVIVELDQGAEGGGPFVTTVKDGKGKSLYKSSSPGPMVGGVGSRRFQLTKPGKYSIQLKKGDKLWLRIIPQKNQPSIYDVEIGADTITYEFMGKFRIRGIKLSSLKEVESAPREKTIPTLWDRLACHLTDQV